MKTFEIAPEDEGKRLSKWLEKNLPALPRTQMQKALRLKRIKRNKKPAKADDRLCAGDVLECYINDEFLAEVQRKDEFLDRFRWRFGVVYEDEHVLIVDKPNGLIVHPDATEKLNTLVTHVRAYLYQRGEYDSLNKDAFPPTPCNRIDRFTSGLVMVAKTHAAMIALNRAIRNHEVEKSYLAIVHGLPRPARGLIDNYILKTEGRRKVQVFREEVEGSQRAQTRYAVTESMGELSLVECVLITGRTHQIRAQFAAMGHPLLGDGQYGDPQDLRRYGFAQQALCAYKLTFKLKDPEEGNPLAALNKQSFSSPLDTFEAIWPELSALRGR